MRPSSALWWQCADSHHTPDRLGGTTAAYYSSDNGYCMQWYTGNQDSNGEQMWIDDQESFEDVYHIANECQWFGLTYCGDASPDTPCDGPFGTSNGEYLYIGISGYALNDGDDQAGWIMFEVRWDLLNHLLCPPAVMRDACTPLNGRLLACGSGLRRLPRSSRRRRTRSSRSGRTTAGRRSKRSQFSGALEWTTPMPIGAAPTT